MNRALLIVHSKTFFPRMFEFGKMLRESHRFEPVFYLAYKKSWANLPKAFSILQAEQFEVSKLCRVQDRSKRLLEKNVSAGLVRRLIELLPKFILKRMLRLISADFVSIIANFLRFNVLMELIYFTRRIRFVIRLIRREKPSIMVLSYDCPQYDTAAFIKAAHKEHIPSVVAISQTGLGEEWVEVYSENPSLGMNKLHNRLIGIMYPAWAYKYRGRKFLLMQAGRILAREWLGLAPDNPWIDGSSNADAVLVESIVYYQRGITAGLKKNNLYLTGYAVHDSMAESLRDMTSLRDDVYRKLNLPLGRPMILTSLIPPYYDRKRPIPFFRNYEELVRFWIHSLVAIDGYNVLVSLHPSMEYEDMAYIERWGAKIAHHSIVDLIPLCDFYVASLSSTISWAIACGKPVINFDIGRYRYSLYKGVDGVITIEEKDDFITALIKLSHDRDYFLYISQLQKTCSSKWGLLDGHAGSRILNIFDILLSRYKNIYYSDNK